MSGVKWTGQNKRLFYEKDEIFKKYLLFIRRICTTIEIGIMYYIIFCIVLILGLETHRIYYIYPIFYVT